MWIIIITFVSVVGGVVAGLLSQFLFRIGFVGCQIIRVLGAIVSVSSYLLRGGGGDEW